MAQMLEHKRENWCPGWESNPHEEKSPEDFKFHSNEESTTYTVCDEMLRSATSAMTARTWDRLTNTR